MNKKGTTSEATPKKDIIIGSGKGIDIIINLKKKLQNHVKRNQWHSDYIFKSMPEIVPFWYKSW